MSFDGEMLRDFGQEARLPPPCPRGIYPYWREIWLERVA
jgi:hypothetical protein